jgi:hypothetical protein
VEETNLEGGRPFGSRRQRLTAAALGLAAALPEVAQASDGTPLPAVAAGRTHVVECNAKTVSVGVLDPRSEPAAVIASGDVVHYPNTWLNWANEPKHGMTFEERGPVRRPFPGGRA